MGGNPFPAGTGNVRRLTTPAGCWREEALTKGVVEFRDTMNSFLMRKCARFIITAGTFFGCREWVIFRLKGKKNTVLVYLLIVGFFFCCCEKRGKQGVNLGSKPRSARAVLGRDSRDSLEYISLARFVGIQLEKGGANRTDIDEVMFDSLVMMKARVDLGEIDQTISCRKKGTSLSGMI